MGLIAQIQNSKSKLTKKITIRFSKKYSPSF